AVIDHFIRAQSADEGQVVRRSGANHVRALPAGKLDGENTDTTRSPVDQHALPRSKVAPLDESLPGGERRDRHYGGRDVIERAWFAGDLGPPCQAVFGLCAIAEPIIEPIDRIPNR